MAPAPRLPQTDDLVDFGNHAESAFVSAAVAASVSVGEQTAIEQAFQQQFDAVAAMHKGFIEQQSAVHAQFLAMRTRCYRWLCHLYHW